MKQVIAIGIFLMAIISAGCHTTKKINAVIARKDSAQLVLVDPHADSMNEIHSLVSQITSNQIDYKTFAAKIKVDYWDKDGKGPDLTIFVRMQKDSIIWLSINATVFSYEAFRVLITPDSVKMLNKKDKIVQFRSSNYLMEVAHLPFDFKGLQNLIIGNPVFLDSNIVSYKKEANSTSLLCIGELFKNLLTIANDNHLIQHCKLDDVNPNRNRTADLSYSNYSGALGKSFATFRDITLTEKNKFKVQLDFKQFSFNETLNYPFSVPKNYTVQ